jgi:hypothetical protein
MTTFLILMPLLTVAAAALLVVALGRPRRVSRRVHRP